MTRLLTILALAALSCATSRAREELSGPPSALTRDPHQATLTRTGLPASRESPECRAPKLRTIPAEPAVDWMPRGCPPQFLSCFSGADGEQMRIYLQSIRQWARDAERRCSHGGR